MRMLLLFLRTRHQEEEEEETQQAQLRQPMMVVQLLVAIQAKMAADLDWVGLAVVVQRLLLRV